MWFKNAQDTNMRILRWRLKLAEYDYEVIYKAGKTNVNADALSRNPIDLHLTDCKIVQTRSRSKLNPNNPKDAETIRQLLEEDDDTDEEEKDLYSTNPLNHYPRNNESDEEDTHEIYALDNGSHQENDDTYDPLVTSFIEPNAQKTTVTHPLNSPYLTQESLSDPMPCTSRDSQELTETIIPIPEPTTTQSKKSSSKKSAELPKPMVTRSQTRQKIGIDVLQETSIDEETDKDRGNTDPPLRATRNNANEIISSRDLHFLHKDNLLYFTDTAGNPVDTGAAKLFERQELPRLSNLSVSIPKLLKKGKRYHIILPISENQKEGPTMILDNINQANILMFGDYIFFWLELNDIDLEDIWFQQDGATPHFANETIALLRQKFPGRIIARNGDVTWPPRSCDLTPADYFLWGYVKSQVYKNNPQSIPELKDEIIRVIGEIEPQLCQNVIQNFNKRVVACGAARGGHLSDIIFRI